MAEERTAKTLMEEALAARLAPEEQEFFEELRKTTQFETVDAMLSRWRELAGLGRS